MSTNAVAVYFNSFIIHWSSVLIFFGVLAFITMTLALWKAKNPRSAALGCFFPLTIILSFLFSRLFHWYFNMEQYSSGFGSGILSGLISSLTRFDIGSYCLPGVILGVLLAAFIVHRLGFVSATGRLLDFAAPGICLFLVFARLSAFFNSSFIGKRPVTISVLQRFPFCVTITDAAGNLTYRPAIFMLEVVLMLLAFVIVLGFFLSSRTVKMNWPCKSTGNVWRMFLLAYSAIEIVTDSLRTDSPLMHFTFLTSLNAYSAFISFAQVTAVAFLLYVFLYYLICSIRSGGFSWKHALAILFFILSLVGVGYFGEYSIQRYGTVLRGYVIMVISLMIIISVSVSLYRSCAPEPEYYD